MAYSSWSPYARLWNNLPRELQEELESRMITSDPRGGDVAAKALKEPDIVEAVVMACPSICLKIDAQRHLIMHAFSKI